MPDLLHGLHNHFIQSALFASPLTLILFVGTALALRAFRARYVRVHYWLPVVGGLLIAFLASVPSGSYVYSSHATDIERHNALHFPWLASAIAVQAAYVRLIVYFWDRANREFERRMDDI